MNMLQIRQWVFQFLRGWGFSIVAAVLIATSFKSAIADWNDVPTGSMKPTILVGDRVFINKLSYGLKIPYTTRHIARWGSPERGDIVVFYSPIDGKRLIKRLIGLPGDKIALLNNKLYINGTALGYRIIDGTSPGRTNTTPEDHTVHLFEDLLGKQHPIMISGAKTPFDSFDPVVVPDGNVFVMGDNRDNSADSRFFGFVELNQVLGHATTIVLSRDGSFLKPRWERFFKKLS
ncbi:signal peptidase I [Thermodesulfobacteriota bacterium]